MEEEEKIELYQLNVEDILDINIFSNNDNDDELSKLAYTTEITEWESILINVKFNFKDPEYINRGGFKKDLLAISIKKKKLFVSQFTGKSIPEEQNSMMLLDLPNQLPKGITEAKVVEDIKKLEKGF